jgi:hypothetical protein
MCICPRCSPSSRGAWTLNPNRAKFTSTPRSLSPANCRSHIACSSYIASSSCCSSAALSPPGDSFLRLPNAPGPHLGDRPRTYHHLPTLSTDCGAQFLSFAFTMSNNQQVNRLQLNFGGAGAGDRNQYDGGRAFPTTPSTFPQPIGQQEVWGAAQQQGSGNGNGYGGGAGYFQNPYQQAQYQGQQGNLQTQHLQQRFDANGLAQQLSSQHLGGSGRSGGNQYGRQPSPNPQRPRTADNRGYGYGSYGSAQGGPRYTSLYDEEAPKRMPEKYSDNVEKQATMSKSLINTFFKDSVQRARDRNQRWELPIHRLLRVSLTCSQSA